MATSQNQPGQPAQTAAQKELDAATTAAVNAVEKQRTQQQKLADKQAVEFAALEAKTLENAETFVVVHPSMNLYVGDSSPVYEASIGTEKAFLDVEDGWVKLPRNTQLTPSSAEQLQDFRLKTSLGFLSAVPAAL